ncbi:protease complex subunit PrcB family protein [Flavobacterium sp. MC2016-06]|jgi:hypothetical protein|uniref:protease complex subunit PrcB family protein n=1 Tax=Flavobacterium sp. MC2016-06 TaxID=2676308 RepID=UPI0012BA633C|nr:protease complex subunit PrcB family protein [Flavobacterium sp. MC2016-06]MBU3859571.1 protease complex subunit PrcB family protein [Flavobacterium sp. MC2016-06]
MKKLIVLIALFLALGCSNDSENGKTITPILIAQGSNSNYPNMISPQNFVIKSQTDWNNLLQNFDAYTIVNVIKETEIDFTKFQVIAVFYQKQSNSSSSIDITKIVENATHITVKVENLKLGITQDVAQPFHIVKIPKSSKSVVFQ